MSEPLPHQSAPAGAKRHRAHSAPRGGLRHQVLLPVDERGRRIRATVELTGRQLAHVRRSAAALGWTVEQYLEAYLRQQLPGQPKGQPELAELLEAEHISFACSEPALARRIERAARTWGDTSVAEFVAAAVASTVSMVEDEMVVHPTSGESLGDTFDYQTHWKIQEEVLLPDGTSAPLRGRIHGPCPPVGLVEADYAAADRGEGGLIRHNA